MHHIIDYKQQDVGSALAALYPRGVDVVYEGVGGALRDTLVQQLAPGGRLLQVGIRNSIIGGIDRIVSSCAIWALSVRDLAAAWMSLILCMSNLIVHARSMLACSCRLRVL